MNKPAFPKLQAIRGMNDILPSESSHWFDVEHTLAQIIRSYGYQYTKLPVVEPTELFKRSIGEVTDIVSKEMYTFDDRNGDSLSLRPEGTAGCVRAGIEHGILFQQVQRLWYQGPMFRHERPQKGRYRQFYQLGVEAFGVSGPGIDVELLQMTQDFWSALGIADKVTLELNTLGSPESRQQYRDILVGYFNQNKDMLDETSLERLSRNPLRILDSKNPDMAPLIANAPSLLESLDDASKQYFDALRHMLDELTITYTLNPQLVRGLDYYCHTVFEWVTDQLGAQGTICAGGRYDGLVTDLGGKPTQAIGFALGLERTIALVSAQNEAKAALDIMIITEGDAGVLHGMRLGAQLRDALPDLKISANCEEISFKRQFKRADKAQAQLAIIIGEQELTEQRVSLKWLQEDKPQESIALDQLVERVSSAHLGE